MKRFVRSLREIPKYGWILSVVCFGLDMAAYYFGTLFNRLLGTNAWQFAPKIPCIDDRIPIIGIFMVPYLLSYALWILGFALVSLTGRKRFMNFIAGLSLSYFIGFLFFVFMPTYMDRAMEGFIEYTKRTDFNGFLFRLVYANDGGDFGFNLFPSFHCMISVFCYLGIRKQETVSRGIRIFTLVSTVTICLSTVFVKQHYIIDVVGGVLLAIVCHEAAQKYNLSSCLPRFIREPHQGPSSD